MKTFIPAKVNRPLLKFIKVIFPYILKKNENIHKIIISEEDRQLLKSLKNERVMAFTNHPSSAEPGLIFYVGKVMGSDFRFMANRHVFRWSGGLIGAIIRRLGAFSILPGAADKGSLKFARSVLAAPAGKLLIFPEGGPVSGENDTLMPFQPGFAQLAFWGYEDALNKDTQAKITILPGIAKHIIDAPKEKILAELDKALCALEREVGLEEARYYNIVERLRAIGRMILTRAEIEYGVKVEDTDQNDLDFRIGRVRHALLDRLAERIGDKNYDKGANAILKYRRLQSVAEMLTINYPDPSLPKVSKEVFHWFERHLAIAYNFIVTKREYLLSYPTPERIFEWIAHFESYLFKKPMKGLLGLHLPRVTYLKFAKPFEVADYYSADKTEKRQGMEKMTERTRTDMQSLLDSMQGLSKPLF